MNPLQHILILLVKLYRWTLSPLKLLIFGPLGQCRFSPTCSEYALRAICSHGALSGSWLAARRICRCHPFGGSGPDPVPAVRPRIAKRGAACFVDASERPAPRHLA